MGSSKYYRLWVRDGEPGSNWVELTRFVGMKFKKTASQPPFFSATVYLTSAAQQGYMTANRLFRITNKESTDGKVATWAFGRASTGTGTATDSTSETSAAAGSQEIMTGRLGEPIGDQKALKNGKPIIWQLKGYGLHHSLKKMTYDDDKTLTGTFNNILTRVTDGVLSLIGTARVIAGSIETGPTVSLKVKKLDLLTILAEIARIGDATTKFVYFVEVTNDANFLPVVSLFKPDNALYETANPFSPRDEGRILMSESELVSFATPEDRERVINKVKVRYAGVGTGTSPAETAYATDAAFPEVRDKVIQDPLAQNSATGVLLRDTILNMFKGTATGIKRGEAVLAKAELFVTAFDAVIGDQAGIEDHGVEIIQGKFLEFEYDQNAEQMKVVIGLPRTYMDFFSQHEQAIKRLYGGMTSAIAKRLGGPIAGNASDSNAALPNGSSLVGTINPIAPTFDQTVDDLLSILIEATGTAGGLFDLLVTITDTTVPWTISVRVERITMHNNTIYTSTVVIPAAMAATLIGAAGIVDKIEATLTNRTGANSNSTLNVYAYVTGPHTHDV